MCLAVAGQVTASQASLWCSRATVTRRLTAYLAFPVVGDAVAPGSPRPAPRALGANQSNRQQPRANMIKHTRVPSLGSFWTRAEPRQTRVRPPDSQDPAWRTRTNAPMMIERWANKVTNTRHESRQGGFFFFNFSFKEEGTSGEGEEEDEDPFAGVNHVNPRVAVCDVYPSAYVGFLCKRKSGGRRRHERRRCKGRGESSPYRAPNQTWGADESRRAHPAVPPPPLASPSSSVSTTRRHTRTRLPAAPVYYACNHADPAATARGGPLKPQAHAMLTSNAALQHFVWSSKQSSDLRITLIPARRAGVQWLRRGSLG